MFRRNFRRRFSAPRTRTPVRRFGPRLRPSKEPGYWEVGNFFFEIANVIDQLTPNATIVTQIASLAGGSVGDVSEGQGRALTNYARRLEVGGIVAHWSIMQSSGYGADEPSNSPFGQRRNFRILLCSDRVDSNGSPSIPDWFATGTPAAAVSTSTPPTVTEDRDYPTRIHHQIGRFDYRSYDFGVLGNSPGQRSTTVVSSLSGSFNKRLKLTLDDEHGLFWHFGVFESNLGIEQSREYTLKIMGNIYYRVRF